MIDADAPGAFALAAVANPGRIFVELTGLLLGYRFPRLSSRSAAGAPFGGGGTILS